MLLERDHREFSPSRSERFIPCRGSVNLIRRGTPQTDDTFSKEGKIAHDILEAGLRNGCKTALDAQWKSKYAGIDITPDLNSTLIEFRASINDALDYVWGLLEELEVMWGDAVLYIETYVNPPIFSAPGEAAGFCDIAIYSAKARRLWVIDYKHGAGIAKAAKGNTQVKQYACGFLFDEQQYVDPSFIDVVTIVIIQPRAYHPEGEIRSEDLTVAELYEHLVWLDTVIADCLRDDAPLTPGEEQCRFCPAKATCPALRASAVAVINADFRDVGDVAQSKMPSPQYLDVPRLAYIKMMRPMIDRWLDACDAALKEAIMQGQDGHGFKAVTAHPKREYYEEIPEHERVRSIAAMIGSGVQDWELYNVKIKALTEMEQLVIDGYKARVGRGRKKIAAENAKKDFAYFTIKQPSTAITIVENADPRPAIDMAGRHYAHLPMIEPPPTKEGK